MAPVSGKGARSEADDATRGSAVKLAAEVPSRLLTLRDHLAARRARLGVADFGRFTLLATYALLLAELGELGLQNLASRALVAGTHSLRSLARARLLASALLTLVALAAIAAGARRLAVRLSGGSAGSVSDASALALLVGWYGLSGWGEFLGVALRCRGARLHEALLLVVLRAGGARGWRRAALAPAAACVAWRSRSAVSPLPALVLGAWCCCAARRSRLPRRAAAAREVLREPRRSPSTEGCCC